MSANKMRVLVLVILATAVWASGVIPAIIPQSVPTANKLGDSTRFVIAKTPQTFTAGNCMTVDSSGNLTDSGVSTCGGAGTQVNSWNGATGAVIYTVQNAASDLTNRLKLNFTGAGVSAADNSGTGATDVTIPGVNANQIYTGISGALFDSAPASSQTQDDEFSANSLNVKWTQVQSGATVDYNSTLKDHIYLKETGNQAYEISQSYAPGSSNFTVALHARVFIQAINSTTPGVFITLLDAAEANAWRWGIDNQGAGTIATNFCESQKTTNVWSFNQNCYSIDPRGGSLYFMISRTAATTWTFWGSYDGIAWNQFLSSSKTLTVDHVNIQVSPANNGASVNRLGIDWFRRDWLTP